MKLEGLNNIFEIYKLLCETWQKDHFCDDCPAGHLCNGDLYEKALKELKEG